MENLQVTNDANAASEQGFSGASNISNSIVPLNIHVILATENDIDIEQHRAKIVFEICVKLKSHSHINNVFSHISNHNWFAIEDALWYAMYGHKKFKKHSFLFDNVVDLLVAQRGVTGRILTPFFRKQLSNLVTKSEFNQILDRIENLYLNLNASRHSD